MKVFIGCSSKNDIDDIYFEKSKDVISCLSDNYDLVFGVDTNGLMGECYRTFKDKNKKIYGIVNDVYSDCLNNIVCDYSEITFSTLDRTKKIIEISDMFVFLPGGIGTYAEIFNIIEEKRNYCFDKKVVIYNCKGFYSSFIDMVNLGIKLGFISCDIWNYFLVVDSLSELKKII